MYINSKKNIWVWTTFIDLIHKNETFFGVSTEPTECFSGQQVEKSAAFSGRGNILTKARSTHFIKITGDLMNLQKRVQTRLTRPDSGPHPGPESIGDPGLRLRFNHAGKRPTHSWRNADKRLINELWGHFLHLADHTFSTALGGSLEADGDAIFFSTL